MYANRRGAVLSRARPAESSLFEIGGKPGDRCRVAVEAMLVGGDVGGERPAPSGVAAEAHGALFQPDRPVQRAERLLADGVVARPADGDQGCRRRGVRHAPEVETDVRVPRTLPGIGCDAQAAARPQHRRPDAEDTLMLKKVEGVVAPPQGGVDGADVVSGNQLAEDVVGDVVVRPGEDVDPNIGDPAEVVEAGSSSNISTYRA